MKKLLLLLLLTVGATSAFARTTHTFTVVNDSDSLINCNQTNNWGNNITGNFNVITGQPYTVSFSQQNGNNVSFTEWSCQFDHVNDTVNFEAQMTWLNGPEYLSVGRVIDSGNASDTDNAQPHYCVTTQNQNVTLTFYNASESTRPSNCTNILPAIFIGGE